MPHRPKINAVLRRRAYIRAKWRCEYCGLKFREPRKFGAAPMRELGMFLEVDHIKPYIDGGPDTPQNFRAACSRCNRSRGVDREDKWAGRMVAQRGA